MRVLIRFSIAAALGLSAAMLVSCGSSPGGLIPLASAGPLRGDFETVARAAQAANGDCKATTQALATTERDFRALPSIDAGLHSRLSEGIKNLRSQALALCEQPLANTSTATTTKSIQTTPTNTATQTIPTTTTTQSTPTNTTSTQTNTQLPPGGGTQAPSEGASEGAPPAGGEKGEAPPNPGSSGGTSQGATK
jgi:hypothetical protein